jgi:hypothetical protein
MTRFAVRTWLAPLVVLCSGCAARPPQPAIVQSTLAEDPPGPPRVEFATNIRPILERCQPCHFEGGVMYERLPFDRPETVHLLGDKLFTRIHDERERGLISAFLASGPQTHAP